MISGHCRTAFARMLSEMPTDALSEEDWLILRLTMITAFRLFNYVIDLCRNAFGMSASSNKTVSAFHLFHCLFAIKSANNAR